MMIQLNAELNLVLQGFIAVILIGMFYSLWLTTRAYGGLIGRAIRLLGVGIILVSVVVLEKMLINFSVIENSTNMSLLQDSLTLLGLIFLAAGFNRLASAVRS